MALVHKHSPKDKAPKITRPWASVDSAHIGISKAGKTPLWSTGFAGCIGVVVCGTGSWGAMAHFNQRIQWPGKSLELALTTLAEFIRTQTKDKISEVLLYYGDPKDNLGHRQGSNLTEAKVKELMSCQRVIDLRRKDDKAPYGIDFVYDPSLQAVYTNTGGMAYTLTGLDDDKVLSPTKTAFPYKDDATKKLLEGCGDSGWFFVP